MIRSFLLLLSLAMCVCGASAQQRIVNELQQNRAGQGKVTVSQDARITALLGTIYEKTEVGDTRSLKVRGYRLQVYAGNNSRTARNEANSMGERVKSAYPELAVYTYFQQPRWLCRVGDYRSIEEADAMMRKLKATGKFKEISIVREQINISLD
ncbi:MAG: SPOR domain-containing protein [Phocaeicola sp.]